MPIPQIYSEQESKIDIIRTKDGYILKSNNITGSYIISHTSCEEEQTDVQFGELLPTSEIVFNPSFEGLFNISVIVGTDVDNINISHYPSILKSLISKIEHIICPTCVPCCTEDCSSYKDLFGSLLFYYFLNPAFVGYNTLANPIQLFISKAITNDKCSYIDIFCTQLLETKIKGTFTKDENYFKKIVGLIYVGLYFYEKEIIRTTSEDKRYLDTLFNWKTLKKCISKIGLNLCDLEAIWEGLFEEGVPPVLHSVTVSTIPLDAVVRLNGQITNTASFLSGTSVLIEVSRAGYTTYTETVIVTEDIVRNITLEETIQNYTVTVNPTPSDSIVTLNGQQVSTLTVPSGTVVAISVSKTGYITHTENVTVTSNVTRNITLQQVIQNYTLTINPTPSDAIVTLNGQVTNSITVPQGTSVTVNVAKTGYITHNSSVVVNASQVLPITLQAVPVQYTLTVTANPSDSTILLNGQATNTLTVNAGTVINMVVSRAGYITQSESITMNSTQTRNIVLLEDLTPSFPYYWGEIGNIFAANPGAISEANWDTQIKHDGTNGGMLYFSNASSFPADMDKIATGLNYQWWIVLIPSNQSAIIADLPNYDWYIWDELLQSWVTYTDLAYEGTVTLDGITWTYRAIRPTVITRIKFSKV